MASVYAILTLKDDTIITATSKSTETSPSLDYIPGRQVLGCVASRLYMQLDNDAQRFDVFHGGSVRFMDAVPLHQKDGRLSTTFAMPLSFHCQKGRRYADRKGLLHTVQNWSTADIKPTELQFKQLRSGNWTEKGEGVQVSSRSSMRVALKEGRARDGFLFGYDAIEKGTRFLCRIDIDDEQYRQPIIQALGQEIRIGRSKTAEYGRVKVELVDIPKQPVTMQTGTTKVVSLYFASDVAMINDVGAPSLSVEDIVQYFGAKRCLFDRTFLRTRTYSPFHGFRCRPDMERQVFVRGSVVTLAFEELQDREELRKKIENGLGLFCHEGLGSVWIDPGFLQHSKPFNRKPVAESPSNAQVIPLPERFAFLERHYAEADRHLNILAKAEEWKAALVHTFGENGMRRITSSQWGQLRSYSRNVATDEALLEQLTGFSSFEGGDFEPQEDTGHFFSGQRKTRKHWGFSTSIHSDSIAVCLSRLMFTLKSEGHLPLTDVVYQFAKMMQSKKKEAQS